MPMAAGTASRRKCPASEPFVRSCIFAMAIGYASMALVSIIFLIWSLINRF
jgi:hypothetical protein